MRSRPPSISLPPLFSRQVPVPLSYLSICLPTAVG
nr:MAG TPA: hypothetical protein [Crassvirales sp.]